MECRLQKTSNKYFFVLNNRNIGSFHHNASTGCGYDRSADATVVASNQTVDLSTGAMTPVDKWYISLLLPFGLMLFVAIPSYYYYKKHKEEIGRNRCKTTTIHGKNDHGRSIKQTKWYYTTWIGCSHISSIWHR